MAGLNFMEHKTLEPEQTDHPGEDLSQPEKELVKPFTDHLEDLRSVLIRSLLAIGVASGICFYFMNDILKIYMWPLTAMAGPTGESTNLDPRMLRSLAPADAFMVGFKVVVVTGILLASPYIFYQIWLFLRPGLNAHEKRFVKPIFASGVFFFILGVSFCYFIVLRVCLNFFWMITVRMGIQPDWTINSYISFVATLLLAFGIMFEMPVLSMLLAKFNLIDSRMLASKRRYAYFAITILAALTTPPDIFSYPLMIVPMLGLYELSILIIKIFEKNEQNPYTEHAQ